MDRYPVARHHDVVTDERTLFRQSGKVAVNVVGKVWELASEGCIGKYVAYSPFNINPAVHLGGPCGPTHIIELAFDRR